jgi:Uma2 family endonuclease
MATAPRRHDGELPTGFDVEAFLTWARDRQGQFELQDGRVVAMAPERVRHAVLKGAVFRALGDAISRAKLDCCALPDGVGVMVSDRIWYQPDALVYCGPSPPDDQIFVANPVIVVEVSSPSTANIDGQQKLVGYFSVPSIHHYLIVAANSPVVHHQRQTDGTILTRLVASGPLQLDPPGLEIDASSLFA